MVKEDKLEVLEMWNIFEIQKKLMKGIPAASESGHTVFVFFSLYFFNFIWKD